MSTDSPQATRAAFDAALKAMELYEAKRQAAIAARIAELVEVYGSCRKLGRALGIDHAYLHRLMKGTKTDPSKIVLRKLGLVASGGEG